MDLAALYSEPTEPAAVVEYVSPLAAEVERRREAHQVEASRIDATEHTSLEQTLANLRAELTPHFQEPWDRRSPKEAHLTGKRMGKSEYFARRLVAAALEHPRSTNPYIAPTAKQARLIMWPILKRVVERHVPDAKVLDHEMTVRMPEGGLIVVGGCENRNDIGRWFGIPFAVACPDECGTFPPYLRELVSDGLEPSTMDFGGSILMGGNPGVAPIGYWYDITGAARLSTIPLYTGDARDNPHVKAAAFFEAKLAENGWTEDHPTFQRMYLGKWAWDPDALCFPYKHERNAVEELPEVSLAGGKLDKARWRFVIGADVAGVGITAITIVAVHPDDPRTFIYSSESHVGWLPEQLVARVETIKGDDSRGFDLSKAAFVVDTGGLGSVHNVHLTRKAGHLYFEPADKADKKSWVRDLHDETLSGRLAVCYRYAQGWIDACAVLEWDEVHELWVKGPPDHEIDAGGYAKRRSLHYTREANRPVDDSPEARQQRDYEALRLAAQRRVMGTTKNGRAAWDR